MRCMIVSCPFSLFSLHANSGTDTATARTQREQHFALSYTPHPDWVWDRRLVTTHMHNEQHTCTYVYSACMVKTALLPGQNSASVGRAYAVRRSRMYLPVQARALVGQRDSWAAPIGCLPTVRMSMQCLPKADDIFEQRAARRQLRQFEVVVNMKVACVHSAVSTPARMPVSEMASSSPRSRSLRSGGTASSSAVSASSCAAPFSYVVEVPARRSVARITCERPRAAITPRMRWAAQSAHCRIVWLSLATARLRRSLSADPSCT